MLRHLEEMSSLTGAQHISYSVFYPESYPGNLSKNLFFTQLADLKQKRVDDNLLLLSMNVADIEKRLNHQSRLWYHISLHLPVRNDILQGKDVNIIYDVNTGMNTYNEFRNSIVCMNIVITAHPVEGRLCT